MKSLHSIRKGLWVKRYGERRKPARPVVYGSRWGGSYTKRDNEEPKRRRKMRQASQKQQRGR